jgi:hypothetical protein
MLKGGIAVVGGCLITLAIAVAPASAATTRAEYVAQVDPICQNGQAQEAVAAQPLLRATKRAKKHRNRKTSRKADRALLAYFAQYSNIERAVNIQISTIPTAPDDVSLIQVWLRVRGETQDSESQIFNTSLNPKAGFKGLVRFFALLGRALIRQQEAVDMVRDFGFQYCSQTASDPLLGVIGAGP